MNKFRYWERESGSVNDCYEVETFWGKEELQYVAQAAAHDFHSNHDGGDWLWPLQFVIADESGELGTFSVKRYFSPTFSAVQVKS